MCDRVQGLSSDAEGDMVSHHETMQNQIASLRTSFAGGLVADSRICAGAGHRADKPSGIACVKPGESDSISHGRRSRVISIRRLLRALGAKHGPQSLALVFHGSAIQRDHGAGVVEQERRR